MEEAFRKTQLVQNLPDEFHRANAISIFSAGQQESAKMPNSGPLVGVRVGLRI